MIRDPYRYSDSVLVIPPGLTQCLSCFDGSQTELDLRAELVRITGGFDVQDILRTFVDTLSGAGFLEDEQFENMRESRRQDFAEQAVREPSHAGAAYPADPEELRTTLDSYMNAEPAADSARDGLFALAAPHVSPEGGWRSYASAYSVLRPEHKDRTFVILATSHYGRPETFGLTRKPFRTPLGTARTDAALVDWLAEHGGPAAIMEDYCHSFEHTVELQVIFLQHALGPGVRILPVLCGPFAKSVLEGGKPEDDDGVSQFIRALGELRQREPGLFWILGVDMAHMGARYGDSFAATAGEGRMLDASEGDWARIERITAGDPTGFWELVRENRDSLKWCGSSAFYAFLKCAPEARGQLLRYEQWNIDEQSVVSFAGLAFRG